jgi:hypothetical protein
MTPREPEGAETVESQPWHPTSRKGTHPLAELRAIKDRTSHRNGRLSTAGRAYLGGALAPEVEVEAN